MSDLLGPQTRNVDIDPQRITPLYDFLLIRRIDDEQRRGLIEIPQASRQQPTGLRKGVVLAAGRGDKQSDAFRQQMHVQVGDTVVYPRTPANDVMIQGTDMVFIHEECVLAVLEA